MAIMFVTLIVLLFAALPTWPYGAISSRLGADRQGRLARERDPAFSEQTVDG